MGKKRLFKETLKWMYWTEHCDKIRIIYYYFSNYTTECFPSATPPWAKKNIQEKSMHS